MNQTDHPWPSAGRLAPAAGASSSNRTFRRRREGRVLRDVSAGLLVSLVLALSPLAARAGGALTTCDEASFRAALNGGGQVTFSSDCTITLSQQIIINQAETTIDAGGYNVVISGSNSVPLFQVATNLVLRGLSLINGLSTNAGAALYVQPGATVVASQCLFAANSVTASNGLAGASGATNSSSATGQNGANGTPGASGLGGAIYNLGNVALVNCTLTNNAVTGGAGGAGGNGGAGSGTFAIPGNGGAGAPGGVGFGGAVYNLGNLTLINCSFSGNQVTGGAGGAGGSNGTGGTNGAGTSAGIPGNGGAGGAAAGGAVFNANNLTLFGSTFSTNSALGGNSATAGIRGNGTGVTGSQGGDASGGALYNGWWAVVTNCTFYTNTVFGGAGANGGPGGGTFGVPGDGGNGGDGVGGSLDNANTITIVNCTFSTGAAFGGTNGVAGTGNFTGANGNTGNTDGGNIASVSGSLTLLNSILTGSPSGMNVFGSLTDAGHNLSSDSVKSFGSSSLQNTDPKLGTLSANGGPTLTMALLTNSPAIDRIPPNQGPATDQRGFSRPAGNLSDIGAFEFGAVGPATNATNVTLSISRATNGVVQLSGAGTSGLAYVVQASTDLTTWQAISTNVAPIQFTDPATNLPARYYRLTR